MDIPKGFVAVVIEQEILAYSGAGLNEKEVTHLILHQSASFQFSPNAYVSLTWCWWWEGLVLR